MSVLLSGISIHTLHTEGDVAVPIPDKGNIPISIHTLHTEGDCGGFVCVNKFFGFQSTPSTRRVTAGGQTGAAWTKEFQSTPSTRRVTCHVFAFPEPVIPFQSTPSTRRVTHIINNWVVIHPISIHTLHTEGDEIKYGTSKKYKGFQSTPSTRRVTLPTV